MILDTALDVIESAPELLGWDGERTMLVTRIALAHGILPAQAEMSFPRVPPTLVERLRWFFDPSVERALMGSYEVNARLLSVCGILIAEVEATEYGPAPNKLARRYLELAVERPVMLLDLVWRLRGHPMLLADMAMLPATSALACQLIAEWVSPAPSMVAREVAQEEDAYLKLHAFADAASVLGHHAREGAVELAECAGLFATFFEQPGRRDDAVTRGVDEMRSALRRELLTLDSAKLHALVDRLTERLQNYPVGKRFFAAALDIVATGGLHHSVVADRLVEGYVASIAETKPYLTAVGLPPSSAAALTALAIRATDPLAKRFFRPIDLKSSLSEASIAENQVSAKETISKSLRVHIRVLCRAIAGWNGNLPEDLVKGAIEAIRSGCLAHAEKGRVAAFAARFEARTGFGDRDQPIAIDIADAWRVLASDDAEQLLSVLLECDEPLLLAQLIKRGPISATPRISKRLLDLTPSMAGDAWTWTDLQLRQEALLSADLPEIAAAYLQDEEALQGQSPPPQHLVGRLKNQLTILLMSGDWNAIARYRIPQSFPKAYEQDARELILFYQGLAALQRPNSDPKAAEATFSLLAAKNSHVGAYVVNLFAARLKQLTNDRGVGKLSGEELLSARKLLQDCEHGELNPARLSLEDRKVFDSNRALLLMLLGRPADALALLQPLRAVLSSSTLEVHAAIATAELGRTQEALAILDAAVVVLGSTDELKATRAAIAASVAVVGPVAVSSADSPIPAIRDALLNLKLLDPRQQAEVLSAPPHSLPDFIIDHVRCAAASLIELVPMLRTSGSGEREIENDLTAAIRELLTSRLGLLGWAAGDQSIGGWTRKLNPGERDLKLSHGTTVLAIVEALACTSVDTTKLKSHFTKLFAYAACNLFFHLTYAYTSKLRDILDYLREIAEADAPSGYAFQGVTEVETTDTRPAALIARYVVEHREIQVVFVVLGMAQDAMKGAVGGGTSQSAP